MTSEIDALKAGSGKVVVVAVVVVVVVVVDVVVEVAEVEGVGPVVVASDVIGGSDSVLSAAQAVTRVRTRRTLQISGAAAGPANHKSQDKASDGSPDQ